MPVAPKRASQRRRTNSPTPDSVEMDGVVVAPELALSNPHPLAEDLYESLARSGQSRYYEPSDWQRARLMCELLSRQLWSGRVSSSMYAALQQDLAMLMTCEGERRRLRMEIERVDKSSASQADPRVELMNSLRGAA